MTFLLLALFQDPAVETVTLPGTKVSFELVAIPAGTYKISSPDAEGTLREIELPAFSIGRREVTWREFNLFYEKPAVDGVTRPSIAKSYLQMATPPEGSLDDARPVINLRWPTATAYCEWLSAKTGHAYRLPTEAEWEAACRAGLASPAPADVDAQAWHEGNSGGNTHDAGGKAPNAFGIHDLLGNVFEYCLEPMKGPEYGPVLRGGAWNSKAAHLRFGRRQGILREWFEGDPQGMKSVWWLTDKFSQGFRVVRVPNGTGHRPPYAGKIEIRIDPASGAKRVSKEQSETYVRVAGEVKNAGDRTLDELELTVHYRSPDGEPRLLGLNSQNVVARAIHGRCHPVLRSSYFDGPHRRPLRPGESRRFEVEFPRTYDAAAEVDEKKFGARVSAVRFAAP